MAKYVNLNTTSGRLETVTPITTSAGAGDASKLVQTDGTGRLDSSVMPIGIAADTKSVIASEALTAGDFVNVYNNAGTLNCRKADATTSGKECRGFVLSSFASAASATVYFEGTNNQRSGLTIGAMYFLATTAGGITTTPPVAAGNVTQVVGVAVSATEITFEHDESGGVING